LVSAPPPSEPDRRISRLRLSSRWFTCHRIDEHVHALPQEKATMFAKESVSPALMISTILSMSLLHVTP
jgi:hypothetical protein